MTRSCVPVFDLITPLCVITVNQRGIDVQRVTQLLVKKILLRAALQLDPKAMFTAEAIKVLHGCRVISAQKTLCGALWRTNTVTP